MPTMDPYAGAADVNKESQKALLDSIATSGAAGKKAFEDAQGQVQERRNGALAAAQQRQQLTGQNLGGADTQMNNDTASRYQDYMASGNQGFQQNLQATGVNNEAYLSKINAIAPFMQSQNMNKAADRENQYKAVMAQAQVEAAQKAAQTKDQQDFELMKLGITERGQNDRASAAASARVQAANAKPASDTDQFANLTSTARSIGNLGTVDNPLSQANPISAELMMNAQDTAAYNHTNPDIELARLVAQQVGMTPQEIEKILSPKAIADYTKQNTAADKTPANVQAVMKYTNGNTSRAAAIVQDPLYAQAIDGAGLSLNAQVDTKGKLTTGPYKGATPWDAYVAQLNALIPANQSDMKAAIMAEAKPIFQQAGKV